MRMSSGTDRAAIGGVAVTVLGHNGINRRAVTGGILIGGVDGTMMTTEDGEVGITRDRENGETSPRNFVCGRGPRPRPRS